MSLNSLPHNTFKEALARGDRLIGIWVTFISPPVAEVLAGSGFDWLLFDMEHSPNDVQNLGAQLLTVRGTPTAPVVRVPIMDMGWIKRVLDAARRTWCPTSAAPPRRDCRWSRFAPEGLRRRRAARAPATTRYKDYAAPTTRSAPVLQIGESREALDDLDAICRVPGVDALFIGPADLAASLGIAATRHLDGRGDRQGDRDGKRRAGDRHPVGGQAKPNSGSTRARPWSA
jgi:2-keto-3-deoxy-L-rhamnonate aldolase RhmA